jgi:hypothetical protein
VLLSFIAPSDLQVKNLDYAYNFSVASVRIRTFEVYKSIASIITRLITLNVTSQALGYARQPTLFPA